MAPAFFDLVEEDISEEIEQRDLIRRIEREEGTYAEFPRIFHVPNGGWRGAISGAKMQAAGVRPGVPDLCLPLMRVCPVTGQVYGGLYIEMKKQRKGVVSKEQKDWIAYLRGAGYVVFVCKGCDHACDALLWYRSLPPYAPPLPQPTMD